MLGSKVMGACVSPREQQPDGEQRAEEQQQNREDEYEFAEAESTDGHACLLFVSLKTGAPEWERPNSSG